MTPKDILDERAAIARAAQSALAGDAAAKQHAKGRLTIRERILALADPGSFREVGPLAGAAERDADGRIVAFQPANFALGWARLDGRDCIVAGEDFTIGGGSPSPAGLRKSIYTEDLAVRYRVPLVRLHEGSGGSVAGSGGRQGVRTLPAPVYDPPRFASVAKALASVPVACAALGPVAGLPAVRLVSSHYSVMARDVGQVFAGGPALVERALGEKVSKDELGGADLHEASGTIDDVVADEPAAFAAIRRFLAYMPANVWELPPVVATGDPPDRIDDRLLELVPQSRREVYDMREILAAVFDRGSIFEIGSGHAPGLITCLTRLDGVPVGVFANDCRVAAGALTAEGSRKVKRFIEMCEMFHLPIVTLVDEPGFMIGVEAERAGTVRAGAAAVLAAATCTVPWATVVARKSMGLAAAAHFAPDGHVLLWPSAELGPLPVEGGVAAAFRREIEAAPDPEARRAELEAKFAATQSPIPRMEAFSVHDLIDPRETRPHLCEWLAHVRPLLQHHLGPRTFAYRP